MIDRNICIKCAKENYPPDTAFRYFDEWPCKAIKRFIYGDKGPSEGCIYMFEQAVSAGKYQAEIDKEFKNA